MFSLFMLDSPQHENKRFQAELKNLLDKPKSQKCGLQFDKVLYTMFCLGNIYSRELNFGIQVNLQAC